SGPDDGRRYARCRAGLDDGDGAAGRSGRVTTGTDIRAPAPPSTVAVSPRPRHRGPGPAVDVARLHRPAVGVGHGGDDRQSEARTRGGLAPREPLRPVHEHVGRGTLPFVAHHEVDPRLALYRRDPYVASPVLERVAHQVRERL